MSSYTPKTIWNCQQNHPELVVLDCKREFGLDELQCARLREILLERGVNKWLYARRLFIRLKHQVKIMVKEATPRTKEHQLLNELNRTMQAIAKMPRWVEWSPNKRACRAVVVVKGPGKCGWNKGTPEVIEKLWQKEQ